MITDKRSKGNRFTWFFKRTPIFSAVLIVALIPVSADAFEILLGTGETGTFSHFTGRTLCRMINRHAEDIQCKLFPALDDVYNLTNLQGGSLDLVLVDSLLLHDAVGKTGYFEFLDIRYDNLRGIAPLYEIPITLVVRKDANIHSLEDLKGKKINAGAPGSFRRLAMDKIMNAKNWSEKDFRLMAELPASQSQDTMAFCHGTVQGMLHVGVHPDPALQQLFRLCKAALVDMQDQDIQKLTEDHPAFSKIAIAGDTYPAQPKAVVTFGTRMMLVASGDLDDQTVYNIVGALYGQQQILTRAHPALSHIGDKKLEKEIISLPLHPGAVKYFTEKGM